MERIPKLDIQQIEVPIIRQLEPPVVMPAPVIRNIERPVIQVPSADIPSYEPIDAPTLEEWKKIIKKNNTNDKEEEEESTDKPRQLPPPAVPKVNTPVIEVPYIGEIPVPPKETVILSGTTATASVAAALIGKSLVEQLVKILKPIIKTAIVKGKQLLGKDLTPYESQLLLSMDLDAKVKKSLQKDLKIEKRRQFEDWHELQQHPNKFLHTEIEDENESHSS